MTWIARLALDYRLADGRTVLSRRHEGPLRVQKALYPEGAQLCHTLIVHPPGGIAGGDALDIEARVGPTMAKRDGKPLVPGNTPTNSEMQGA